MQPDDTFRQAFAVGAARLSSWTEAQRDAADVDCEQSADYWRVQLLPHMRNACAVELIVQRQSQSFDIDVAGLSWERQPIKAFSHIESLLQAIVDGRVVVRDRRSAATNAALGIEIVIGDGPDRTALQTVTNLGTSLGRQHPDVDAVVHAQHFVAYRR